jgi:hypothetical protein
MRGSYIAHFTNVSMRFTTGGGLNRISPFELLISDSVFPIATTQGWFNNNVVSCHSNQTYPLFLSLLRSTT